MSEDVNKKIKPTLLIVDDEDDIRYTLDIVFQAEGVHCLAATDGQAALDVVQNFKPIDAIISDINMPNMDGLQFMEKIRELGYRTPVIFLTGRGDKENAVRALQLGAFDFIDKPYELPKLKSVVKGALDLGMAMRDYQDEILRISNDPKLTPDAKKIKLQMLLLKINSSQKKTG